MHNAIFNIPKPVNEPIFNYAPGSKEKAALEAALKEARSKEIDVPMYIGESLVKTDKKIKLSPPHDHKHVLGYASEGDASHVNRAIEAALAARGAWAALPWNERSAIFLKAADLLAGPYRAKMNAATMLAQSKNAFQSEIDSVCELIDFLRFNASFYQEIISEQPVSSAGIWNKLEYFSSHDGQCGGLETGLFANIFGKPDYGNLP
jgi:1-pyrroline-5-carboxylate dehydrogenase